MKCRLTTISGAPRGWRVLLGTVFDGLAAEVGLLKLSTNHHKADPFVSLNSRGKVPVSECEGVGLRDSGATLTWLDRKYPDAPSFGVTEIVAAMVPQNAMAFRQYPRRTSADFLTPVLLGILVTEMER